MKKRLLGLVLSALCVTTIIIGCGGSETTSSATDTEETTETTVETGVEVLEDTEVPLASEASQYPIVIKHAFGETVITSKPERIVTVGWCNEDAILALGVTPVGVSAANYGKVTDNMLHLWTADAFAALGEDNPNVFNDLTGTDYEAIAAAEPDIIVASYSGFSEEEYALLSDIAPVVPYLEIAWKTTWREQTITNATAIGMKTEGEELVEKTDALIQEKIAAYPELNGKSAGFFWVSADDMSIFYAYLTADPRASFLNDLGLTTPASIKALEEDENAFSVTISRENAEMLNDVDIMVVYGDEALLEAMQADPLMSKIPAVKNGAVVLLDSTSVLAAATTPSVLSIPYSIDEYLQELSEAAKKSDATK